MSANTSGSDHSNMEEATNQEDLPGDLQFGLLPYQYDPVCDRCGLEDENSGDQQTGNQLDQTEEDQLVYMQWLFKDMRLEFPWWVSDLSNQQCL